ncbi:MAG TPA: BatD family protein [Steroidobacteraceae bacterium]
MAAGAALLAAFSAAPANLVMAAASAAAVSVDATIEPSQIALGESAQLTIMTSGNGALALPLPVVSGLEFRVIGQSRRIEIVNGAAISSTSTIIRVTPEEAGVFTIPGPTPKSPPLVLRVTQGNGSAPSISPNSPSSPGLKSLIPGGSEANGIRLTPDGSAFVRFEVPKREIYVGESVPAVIQVGMRDGFASSINSLPKLNSADFTLNNLSLQPERTAKSIDGKPFTLYTWHSLLAAIKPGTYALAFGAPLTVRIRTRPRGDSMLDDLLGDPFMQNFFGATVSKNITVTSPETAIKVLPLPAEGRPAEFSGAVGSFKISTDLSSATNTAGDPLTLRMHVNGSGNFDRVESNMLAGDGQWKTYQPKAAFSQADSTGYRGEKTFEQPLVALQPGVQTIPPLAFSFFDPGTRRYETVRSAPLRVTVSPSAADSAASPPPVLANAAAPPGDAMHGLLRPDHPEAAARTDSLIPGYLRPQYLGVVSTFALLFGGGWVALHRRERNARDLQRQRERLRREAGEACLKRMASASAARDTALFFSSARSALQQYLSAAWQIAPEHVTLAELDARLGPDADDIRQLFVLADEANYSGDAPQAADFDRWTSIVRRRMLTGATP